MMDLVGWIATGFTLSGWWLIGRQWRHAVLLHAVGGLLWALVGWGVGLWSQVTVELVAVLLAARAWHKWGSDQGKPS